MANGEKAVPRADCPECGTSIRVRRRLALQEILVCPKCDSLLEVLKLQPLELTWAYETSGGTNRLERPAPLTEDDPSGAT